MKYNKNETRSAARAGDIEEAVDSREEDEQAPPNDTSSSNAQSMMRKWITRRNTIIALLLVAVITIAVLIPTVFLKQDEAGVWKRSFYLHEKHNRTNEYDMKSAHFGQTVSISEDGNRLVFGGEEAVEVWDWQDEEWAFKYRFEGDFRAMRDQQNIHLSHAGTRIALVQRESDIFNIRLKQNSSFDTVVVYDDVSDGEGTEWVQVGETLHGIYSLNFTEPELLLDFSEWAEHLKLEAASNFAFSVGLSGDGTTICTGDPSADTLQRTDNTTSGFTFHAGEVQCFRHIDTFPLPPTEFQNVTWIPTGKIRGTRKMERLGAKVALSADGTVLVATRDISFAYPIASFYKYEEEEWTQTWNVGILGVKTDLFLGGLHPIIAISSDTFTWAVGTPSYDLPDKAGAGRVQVFHFRPSGLHLHIQRSQIADFFGSTKGEYFGRSLSISSGGDFLAVGSYDGIQTFRKNREGKWERYGKLFGKPTQQRECCFDRHPFGENIAISADGKRVVGGTPWRKNKFEGTMGTGDVGVWEYEEK